MQNNINNNTTTNNITNTNTINIDKINNITNNNITNIAININSFGCESLEHISVNDFKYIFKDINNIINKLCYHIFKKHTPNVSFYKNNLNKKIVSYLNKNMEITKMTEQQFVISIKYLLYDLCIELFYIFKDQLSHTELIKYMKNLISHQILMADNNGKNTISQEHNDAITNLLDDAFRNNDIRIAIETMISNINKTQNQNIKLNLINKNININNIKLKIKNNYDKYTNINNTNNITNLYNLKIQAENEIKIEDAKLTKNIITEQLKTIKFNKCNNDDD